MEIHFIDHFLKMGTVVHERSYWIYNMLVFGSAICFLILILDNNILIAIAIAEQSSDWICGISFWNTGESFRELFYSKIAENRCKIKRQPPKGAF